MRNVILSQALGTIVVGGVVLGLSGCANPVESLVQAGVSKAVESATGGQVSVGGGSLPEGIPSSLPLPNGELLMSLQMSEGITLSFKVDESELDRYEAKLDALGLKTVSTMNAGKDFIKAYEGDEWNLGVTFVRNGDSSSISLLVQIP